MAKKKKERERKNERKGESLSFPESSSTFKNLLVFLQFLLFSAVSAVFYRVLSCLLFVKEFDHNLFFDVTAYTPFGKIC
jgi:hypothetical protein